MNEHKNTGWLRILYRYYTKISPSFLKRLRDEIDGCSSILDVGCGENSPLRWIKNKPYCVGVDAHKDAIKKSKKKKIHNKYIQLDLLKLDFASKSFDCVVALDVLEHFEKEDGYRFLRKIEKIAKKKVIVFTPNGFLKQGIINKNPYQVHKSGWSVKEMKKRGYKVYGINGWKPLRGEFAKIKLKPGRFWLVVSKMTELVTNWIPVLSFQIFCVKIIENC
ncbi:MAG: SAM-dependent methyltransferase [Thermoplasmata archaeon]|nr:MAG: SAM-dependent methyltransferase [Thermoplasmata archaeon]